MKSTFILAVDDNRFNLLYLSECLSFADYTVITAESVAEAREKLKEYPFSLILLDIMMPEIDGYTYCTELKKSEETANIPVIFLSARNQTADIIKGFQSGGVDYLVKPFISDELLARVNIHINLFNAKTIISKQNSELLEINKKFKDSILYAGSIQKELFKISDFAVKYVSESFVIHRPIDLLSGDFFKVINNDKGSTVIIADCTGHGVPGAFLSIMALTLLNQISPTASPCEILEYLRTGIKKNLHQKSLDDKIIDGLDMGIVFISKDKKNIEYAGANINLYILPAESNETICITGDKMPVSIWFKEVPFELKKLQIQTGDRIFIYTDGIRIILNNTDNEGNCRTRIPCFFEDSFSLSLSEQKIFIEQEIQKQVINGHQNDDITVIGIKV